MRRFNTSGPNIPEQHYTLFRQDLIEKGISLVTNQRYFTIWAPRQTGKSTYFRLLADELKKIGYKVAHINFENYKNTPVESFLERLIGEINRLWEVSFPTTNISSLFYKFEEIKNERFVLIIDEVEGINKEYFNEFLYSIRNAYHSRQNHSLKSVILVGVSNITGVIKDNASPFNIADNLSIPYFSDDETFELLSQHESETGQIFDNIVKQKICEITANQPGLVNGFAQRLVVTKPDKKIINYEDYLEVETWYTDLTIDKNISNILNVADNYRSFVEKLLFSENAIRFQINRPEIKELYANGLITSYISETDKKLYVKFWVPLYKKVLFDYYFPYTNGEGDLIAQNIFASEYLFENGKINFDFLIDKYKNHIQLRSFRPFREKDEKGKYKSIKEAAMIYSFETFISIFLQEIKGRSYREAYISLGNTDLIINVNNYEYLIETKKYYSFSNFIAGKNQLAYYCHRAGITEGIYIVFIENSIQSDKIKENIEIINNISIKTYLIYYDEVRAFGKK